MFYTVSEWESIHALVLMLADLDLTALILHLTVTKFKSM